MATTTTIIIYHRCRIGEINIVILLSARFHRLPAHSLALSHTRAHTHTRTKSKLRYPPLCPVPIIPVFRVCTDRQTDRHWRTPLQTEPSSSHCVLVHLKPPPPSTKYYNVPEYTRVHINNSGYNNILTGSSYTLQAR